MDKLLLVFACLALWLGASQSQASLITVYGRGNATHASEDLGVTNPFSLQSSVSFSFDYDPQTLDLSPSGSTGRYQISNLRGAVLVGGIEKIFQPNGGSVIDIQVFPEFVDYEWYLRGSIEFDDPELGLADLGVSIRGADVGYLGRIYGDALVFPPKEVFPADQWFVALKRTGASSVTGLGTLEMSVVPEPGTTSLILIASLGFLASRARRRPLE